MMHQHRLRQRGKQIGIGKLTIGYLNYETAIPVALRTDDDPTTPVAVASQSKRCWDATVVRWRRKLHTYDDIADVLRAPCDSWASDRDDEEAVCKIKTQVVGS
jgi:hypothetical protein